MAWEPCGADVFGLEEFTFGVWRDPSDAVKKASFDRAFATSPNVVCSCCAYPFTISTRLEIRSVYFLRTMSACDLALLYSFPPIRTCKRNFLRYVKLYVSVISPRDGLGCRAQEDRPWMP